MYQLLLGLLLLTLVFPASAQTSFEVHEVELKSKASDNWFVSLGGGGALLMGEQDSKKSFGDRLRYNGELSIGKWFNQDFGIRFQFMGGNLRGFNLLENQGGEYTRSNRARDLYPTGYYENSLKYTDSDDGRGFWQDMNYGSVTIDLMANLTNLFRGYYKPSLVEVIPFVGVGYLQGFKSKTNPSNYGIVGKLGIRANFNLTDKWSIYLEPQVNFASEEFDGYAGNRGFDMIANGMVGVQFNINRNFTKPGMLSREEIDAINDKINANKVLIENHQDIIERQQDLLDKLNNCCEEKPEKTIVKEIVTKEEGYIPEYVRFGLDSYRVETTEQVKIADATTYLKANPGSKLLIIGYADKNTGTSSYNLQLSRKRAEAVAAALVKQGISSHRVMINWVGDKEQPYDQNEWNRVVIMVERK